MYVFQNVYDSHGDYVSCFESFAPTPADIRTAFERLKKSNTTEIDTYSYKKETSPLTLTSLIAVKTRICTGVCCRSGPQSEKRKY